MGIGMDIGQCTVWRNLRFQCGQIKLAQLLKPVWLQIAPERIEQCRPNVASNRHAHVRAAQQRGRQRSDRGLAVGARHGQHIWRVQAFAFELIHGQGKQGEFSAHRQTHSLRMRPKIFHHLGRESRTFKNRFDRHRIQYTGLKPTVNELNLGQLRFERRQMRRRLTVIDHPNVCTTKHTPPDHGQA